MANDNSRFRVVENDMNEFYEKIQTHRMAIMVRILIVLALIVVLVVGNQFYLDNKTYSGYVKSFTIERNDTTTTQYVSFHNSLLKYSRDGATYMDAKGAAVFNIVYTMQDPILDIQDDYGAIADKGGNIIRIFDFQSEKKEITTRLTIRDIVISDRGILIALLDDTNATKLEVYDAAGTLLGEGSLSLEDSGYPVNAAISADGTKFVISFVRIQGGTVNTNIAAFNFSNVGENYLDSMVFTKEFEDQVVPEVHYFNSSSFVSVGDKGMTFYSGTQIPEVDAEVEIEEEIQSIFYGDREIGIVTDKDDGTHILLIYDIKGGLKKELSFQENYSSILLMDSDVIIYSGDEWTMYTENGKKRFNENPEETIENVFLSSSDIRLFIVYADRIEAIKLD